VAFEVKYFTVENGSGVEKSEITQVSNETRAEALARIDELRAAEAIKGKTVATEYEAAQNRVVNVTKAAHSMAYNDWQAISRPTKPCACLGSRL